MADVQKQELAKRIRLAFKNVKYPGRKIGDKEELRDLLGKKREEVTIQDLSRNHEFIYFNAQGLQYYLPVYLLTLIEQPDKLSRWVGDEFIEFIAHESEVTSRPCDVMDIFSEDQKAAVLEFMAYFASVYYPTPGKQSGKFASVNKERRQRVQKAIDYWRSCMG